MSSSNASTPSIDSVTDAVLVSHTRDGELWNLEQSFEDLSLYRTVSSNESTEIMHYRGYDIKPLASFGAFTFEPATPNLPWIKDHTSGNVHPDIPTIAMLLHESSDFGLPDAAQEFVSQSPELEDEAEWEMKKAMFYRIFTNVRDRAFETLKEMSSLEASRIIVNNTSRHLRQVPFIPIYSDSCGEEDANCGEEDTILLFEDLRKLFHSLQDTIAGQLESFTTIERGLQKYSTYQPTQQRHPPSGLSQPLSSGKVTQPKWTKKIKRLQALTRECGESRLFLFQLSSVDVWFDRRTQWIYISTEFWEPGVVEHESTPELLREFYDPRFVVEGDEQQKSLARELQIDHFTSALQKYREGHFLQFESYHNDPSLVQFIYRVSYTDVSPYQCSGFLKRYLGCDSNTDFFIASKPVISSFKKRHHEIRVYVNSEVEIAYGKPSSLDESIELVDSHKLCVKCFKTNHASSACEVTMHKYSD